MLFHNSRDLLYRAPFGATPCNTTITLRVRSDQENAQVWLRTWGADKAEERAMRRTGRDLFEITIETPGYPGLLWYYFIEQVGDIRAYYGNAKDCLGGTGEMSQAEPPSFQITVYDGDYKTPEWMRESVMGCHCHCLIKRTSVGAAQGPTPPDHYSYAVRVSPADRSRTLRERFCRSASWEM